MRKLKSKTIPQGQNQEFKRKERLLDILCPFGSAAIGSMIGYGNGKYWEHYWKNEISFLQNNREAFLKRLEGFEELKPALVSYPHKSHKHETLLSKDWTRDHAQKNIDKYTGMTIHENELRNIVNDVPTRALDGGVIGLISGFLLSIIFKNKLRSILKKMSTKSHPIENPAKEENMSCVEDKGDCNGNNGRPPENGNGNGCVEERLNGFTTTAVLRIRSMPDEKTEEKKREQKECEVELAIRGVCGRKYSRETSFALVSALSQRQIQLLIEEPSNLARVLADHKKETDPEFKRYGYTSDQVISEIRKRNEISAKAS